MTIELTKSHREALEALRKDCDWMDSQMPDEVNFTAWEQLIHSHGPKTRSELVELGFAIEGFHPVTKRPGHRITDAGRAALNAPPRPKPPKAPRRNIPQAPSRLGPAKTRWDT